MNHFRHLRIAFAMVLAVGMLTAPRLSAQAAPVGNTITGLFNTGVTTDNNTLATPGSVDAHYTLLTSPYDGITDPPAYVASSYPYDPLPPDAQYIGADPNLGQGFLTGSYTYRTTFDLTGYDPLTASISGSVFADDDVFLYLNGTNTGIVFYTAFFELNPFTIDSGFVEGVNTLDFIVDNSGGGTTSLAVSGLTGTAVLLGENTAAPEPGSAMLLFSVGSGGIGAGMVISRRKK